MGPIGEGQTVGPGHSIACPRVVKAKFQGLDKRFIFIVIGRDDIKNNAHTSDKWDGLIVDGFICRVGSFDFANA
eukprot:5291921-Ditylum_brightwellii.AAC.1